MTVDDANRERANHPDDLGALFLAESECWRCRRCGSALRGSCGAGEPTRPTNRRHRRNSRLLRTTARHHGSRGNRGDCSPPTRRHLALDHRPTEYRSRRSVKGLPFRRRRVHALQGVPASFGMSSEHRALGRLHHETLEYCHRPALHSIRFRRGRAASAAGDAPSHRIATAGPGDSTGAHDHESGRYRCVLRRSRLHARVSRGCDRDDHH